MTSRRSIWIAILAAMALWISSSGMAQSQPLHDAAKEGNYTKVKDLINDGDDVNEKNGEGNTPLSLAVENKKSAVVRLLINNSARVDEKNGKGDTPLILAVKNKDKTIAKILIEEGHTKVDQKNSDGETPLTLAVTTNNRNIVQLLLNGGAKVNATNYTGETAMDLARDKAMQNLLVKHGAQPPEEKETEGTPTVTPSQLDGPKATGKKATGKKVTGGNGD